jgi:hypothetical protein
MKKMFKRLFNEQGVSFIEVLIALAMTAIVTTAVFQLYITQHKNYMTQDDITNIQQNARAAIDEMSRSIRMAGYGVPACVEAIEAYNTDPDTIVLNFRVDNCDTYLSDPMPLPSAELKCATVISCFEEDQWVYIFEPDSGGGEWFQITEVQAAAKHIQHNTMSLSRAYGADAILISMHCIKYYVDNTTDPDHPNLMIQFMGHPPQVYAENVSDLQFTYKMKNGMTVDEPILIDNLREVCISVTARSNEADPDNENDPYRFRTFATSVNMRNIGF